MPEAIGEIKEGAFRNYFGLMTVTLVDGLEEIGR
jgi:hypothetical protein